MKGVKLMKMKRLLAFCLSYTLLFGTLQNVAGEFAFEKLTASAENSSVSESTFEYEVFEDYVKITGYNGSETTVTIPASISSLPVTEIGSSAFSGNQTIEKIVLPSCLETIGTAAFNNCSALKEITLPKSLSKIDSRAFMSCTSLKEFKVDSENTSFAVKNGVLYNADFSVLVAYPAGKEDTEFTVPDTVTEINANAFAGNIYLTSVIMTDTAETTGGGSVRTVYCT